MCHFAKQLTNQKEKATLYIMMCMSSSFYISNEIYRINRSLLHERLLLLSVAVHFFYYVEIGNTIHSFHHLIVICCLLINYAPGHVRRIYSTDPHEHNTFSIFAFMKLVTYMCKHPLLYFGLYICTTKIHNRIHTL